MSTRSGRRRAIVASKTHRFWLRWGCAVPEDVAASSASRSDDARTGLPTMVSAPRSSAGLSRKPIEVISTTGDRRAASAESPHQREPVGAPQGAVDHQDVWHLGGQRRGGGHGVAGGLDLEPPPLQQQPQDTPARGVVVDHERAAPAKRVRRRRRAVPVCSGATSATTVNWNVEPTPGSLSTHIDPPINSASRLLIARPRPVPPYWRVVEAST